MKVFATRACYTIDDTIIMKINNHLQISVYFIKRLICVKNIQFKYFFIQLDVDKSIEQQRNAAKNETLTPINSMTLMKR